MDAQNELLKFENYSKDDGVLHSQILDIYQDKSGLIWIGSYGGLNRFDGTNFVSYSRDNSNMPTNIIYSIVNPKHGPEDMLWLGTNLGLTSFNKRTSNFHYYSQVAAPVFSIEEDENGVLWLATRDQGLLMFDPATGEYTQTALGSQYQTNHPSQTMNCLLYEQSGILWLGYEGGGIIKYYCKFDTFEVVLNDFGETKGHSPNSISCLYNFGSELLMGTIGSGLYIFDKAEQSLRRIPLYLDGKEEIHSSITSITSDNFGHVWVSTFGGGLYKVEGFSSILKGESNYVVNNFRVGDDSPSPICSNLINVLYKDYTGNIWIGSEGGGLSKLDFFKHRISHYVIQIPNGKRVRDNNISAVFEDENGDIWYGVRNNGLYIYRAEKDEYQHILLYPDNVDDRRNAVHDIYGDRYNRIWVSTDLGLFLFKNSARPDTYFNLNRSDANTMNRNAFITMCLDNNDALWISDGDHGIYKLDAEEVDKYNSGKVISLDYTDIPNDTMINSTFRIWGIMCDSDGRVWISTSNGLYQYNEEENSFNHIFTLPINSAFEPVSGSGDYLWMGSYGNGVYLLNTTDLSYINFNASMGLCHNNVHGIVEDRQGNIWLSTAKGIATIYTKGLYSPEMGDLEDESKVERIQNYRKSDGLQAHEFNLSVAEKLSDDRLVFGGPNGFNLFNPLTIEDNKYVFPVLITDFKIFNKSVLEDTSYSKGPIEYVKQIELNHRQNYFTIDFTARCLTSPENAAYQYMLEGFDNEWIFADANHTSATYTKIRADDYVFKVKASNADGIWSDDITALQISIKPPFWQTRQIRMAGIFFLSLIFLFVIFFQRRSVSQRKSKVLLAQKEKYEREKLENALETKNRELATTTMYIVKKNEKLIEVKNMMLELKDHILPDNKTRFMEILTSIEDDLKNQDNWESFELNFNLIHNNFIARLIEKYPTLSHNDVKICAYMRMNLSSKEIANLLHIAPKSLETNRVRIRKRMNLDSSVYLSNFIMRF